MLICEYCENEYVTTKQLTRHQNSDTCKKIQYILNKKKTNSNDEINKLKQEYDKLKQEYHILKQEYDILNNSFKINVKKINT